MGQLNLDNEIIFYVHPIPRSAGDVDNQSPAWTVGSLHAEVAGQDVGLRIISQLRMTLGQLLQIDRRHFPSNNTVAGAFKDATVLLARLHQDRCRGCRCLGGPWSCSGVRA